ncbi:MAG TPA: FAD/NAD(P)-binding oxidoreductase [Phycisphaerae bacterium]|nr:FAD/NAD(P)-binding oxidoreductase [Phycisphaerae bacterium]
MAERGDEFEVAVIGAGPGGIAAAVTAAEAGKNVALVDNAPFAGGQIWRNLGTPAGLGNAAKRWLQRLNSCPGITHLRQSTIAAVPGTRELLADTPAGPQILRWRSLILATGARELYLPFPGWTLPAVVGAGGLQALVKSGFSVQGKRVIVAGTGPLLLAVASQLRAKGAIVPLILEQTELKKLRNFAISLWRTPGKLLAGAALRTQLAGTRYLTDAYPLEVQQSPTGLRLRYRCGRAERTIDCDFLACGFHLVPNNELPIALGCELSPGGHVRVDASLRTSLPDVYAIGELTAIGGVEKAIVEGQIAAMYAVGNELGARPFERTQRSMLQFARRMDETFALRPEVLQLAAAETTICRCEDVPLARIQACTGSRDSKLKTRCGMGPCQGRVCGAILRRILWNEPSHLRPPLFPTSIANLIAAGGKKTPE